MNYLDLCKRARQEAGITGDGPSAVTGQSGQLQKLVDWVSQAWVDIQILRSDWLFMHKEFTFNTVAATRDYVAADYSIDDMNKWDVNSFLIYKTSLGESDQNRLSFAELAEWKAVYRVQMNMRDDGRPRLLTVMPDNTVRFEPRPDAIYTIEGEYKRSTQLLSADADVPTNLPSDFHMIIVWQALKYYGFYEDAPDVLDMAETNFDNLINRLEIEQLPTFSADFEALA